MSQIGAIRSWVLAFVILAGGGMAALLGVGCLLGANTCPFRSGPAQTSTDGRTLFLSNCAACHGPAGEGRSGPSLTEGALAGVSGAELTARIANGKPLAGMPAFKRIISSRQIAAVAAFVESLRSPSPSPSPGGGS